MVPRRSPEAEQYVGAIATEIRAELARQKKTQAQLAEALGLNPITVSRRLSGAVPFGTVEIFKSARWLGVDPGQFYPRAEATA